MAEQGPQWVKDSEGDWVCTIGRIEMHVTPWVSGLGQFRWCVAIPELDTVERGFIGELHHGPFIREGFSTSLKDAIAASQVECRPMFERAVDWLGRDEVAEELGNTMITTHRLSELLKRIEWVQARCPECQGEHPNTPEELQYRHLGHSDECELANLIRARGETLGVEVAVLRPVPGDLFVLRMTQGHKPPMAAIASMTRSLAAAYRRAGMEAPEIPDVLVLGPAATLDLMSAERLHALGFVRLPSEENPMVTDMLEVARRRYSTHITVGGNPEDTDHG
jgi:hypothetical protein